MTYWYNPNQKDAVMLHMAETVYVITSYSIHYTKLYEVRNALAAQEPDFAALGVKVGQEYRQLNDHVLQLENELYAPIRPKRSPRSGERSP